MGEAGRKSEGDCRSIVSSVLGEGPEGPIVIHSISLGNGRTYDYVISILSPLSTGWCWTTNTASSVLRLRADEYPCTLWTT
jgi:hypothetical protein